MQLGDLTVSRFSDGEANIRIKENVRGKDIFVIQPTSPPVNEHLIELLLLTSTMKRSSCRSITVIMPYYGYARQDRKTAPRVPISAADVARMLETMGVDRVVAVDLHCGQIQGFFGPNVPVDNLEANLIAMDYFLNKSSKPVGDDVVIVSPDAGGVARAKKFQEMYKVHTKTDPGLAMIIKHRDMPGSISKMYLVGDVAEKQVIIIDDMLDTGGTMCEAVKELKKYGAKSVDVFVTHALFSGKAYDNIQNSSVDKVVVTNTIPAQPQESQLSHKIVRLSVAPLLAESIQRIQNHQSVSSLFDAKLSL